MTLPPRKKRKSGAKIATKREISGLMDHIGQLIEDPSPLVPTTDGAPPAAVNRMARRFKRIADAHASPRRLRWRMRFGAPLTRAFANLVLVQHSGKASRMGSFKSPVGDLKYAVRGNVSPRHIVAIQHFRYPEVRVLGYRELANETRGVVWATADGVAWTPRDRSPPEAWFDLVSERLPLVMERHDATLQCPHLAQASDPFLPQAPYGLEVAFAVSGLRFHICDSCIQEHFSANARGLLASLAQFVLGLRATKDITVRPTGTPTDCVHEGGCAWNAHPPMLVPKTQDQYVAGVINEGTLLDRIRPRWEEAVRDAGERVYVAGDTCYGDDRAAFLDALGPTPHVREALEVLLDAAPPVLIAAEASVNKVLEATGDTFHTVLRRLHPEAGALDALLERHRRSPPLALLEAVLGETRARAALTGFPVYRGLTGGAATADVLARAHRVDGATGLVAAAERELKQRGHKPTLWAALRAVSATSGREWHFEKNDLDAGEFLEAPFKALLESDADTYHEALSTIHTMSGGAGDMPEPHGRA